MAIPLRIIITAIAAKSRLVILDIVFEPVLPRTRLINGDERKIPPAIKILIIIARDVMTKVCSLIRSIDVVNTAGPVISGTPMGTAPMLSKSTGYGLLSVEIISLMEMIKRSVPPAIMKSATVIPSRFSIIVPKAIKAKATTNAVIID